jgi:hypothetical protein
MRPTINPFQFFQTRKTFTFLALTSAAPFAIIFMILAFNGLPIAVGDKQFFYPVIQNLKTLQQFNHPFLSPISENDYSYIWHGLLYPYTEAKLSFTDSYPNIHLSSVTIFVINSILTIKILKPNLYGYIGVPIFIAIYLYQMGRPELLVSTILLIDALARTTSKNSLYLDSLISALLFLTSPLSAFLHRLFIISFTLKTDDQFFKKSVIHLFISCFFVILIFNFLNPQFSLTTYLTGLYRAAYIHGDTQFNWSYSSYVPYLFSEKTLPNLFISIIIFILSAASLRFSLITGISRAFLLASIFWFGIKNVVNIYNFVILIIPFLIMQNEISHPKLFWNNLFIKRWVPRVSLALWLMFSISIGHALLYHYMYIGSIQIKYARGPFDLADRLNNIPCHDSISIPQQFYFLVKTCNSPNIQQWDHWSKRQYQEDHVFISQYDIGTIERGKIPELRDYCLSYQDVNYRPLGVYEDWAFLHFSRCKK